MKGLEFLDGVDLERLGRFCAYPHFFRALKEVEDGADLNALRFNYSFTLYTLKSNLEVPFDKIPLLLKPVDSQQLFDNLEQGVLRYRLEVGK